MPAVGAGASFRHRRRRRRQPDQPFRGADTSSPASATHRRFPITLEVTTVALLGTAALAMWWDIAPEVRADFEDWHAHEHLPERLSIPGFRRATRWSSTGSGEGMFVMYELDGYEVLASPAYAARLNSPT